MAKRRKDCGSSTPKTERAYRRWINHYACSVKYGRERERERIVEIIKEREKQTGHSSLCHCTGCSSKVVRRLLPPATSVTLTAAFIGRSNQSLSPLSPHRSQPDNRESRALIADRATNRLANESSIRRNERKGKGKRERELPTSNQRLVESRN